MSVPCDCIECRLRLAMPMPAINLNEVLAALSSITGEILAQGDDALTRAFCVELIRKREEWLRHPRVQAQISTAGRA